MKKATLVGILCGIAVIGFGTFYGFGQPPKNVRTNDVDGFMRLKLKHAEEVLSGLVLEDYDRIAKHAQKMSLQSLESNWKVLQTEEYVKQSADFRTSANRLAKAASEKNLDGATLAYVEMTMKCVQCHKYVRKVETPRTKQKK